MSTNKKVYLIVFIMLGALSMATIFNVAYNFRTFSQNVATDKARSIAESVRDGLTAHMVSGTMDKRALFLDNMIKHQDVENLHLFRSKKVIEQFGNGLEAEHVYSKIEDEVLQSAKEKFALEESTNGAYVHVAIPYIATKYSNPNCLECHTNSKEGDVLGVISMDINIENIRNDGLMIIARIFFISLAFLVIAIFVANYYIKPYIKLFNDLEEGISKAYRGDFSHHVQTSLSDEAGKVAARLNELSEIFRFKKTIELDADKETIYNRIAFILKEHFKVDNFVLMEAITSTKERYVVHQTLKKEALPDGVFVKDALSCRAFRTGDQVISTEFYKICETCHRDGCEFICIPFIISDEHSLILHIRASEVEEIERIKDLVPIISNYFELADPVLESKYLMKKLEESSLRDAPTGLYNRRYLDSFVESSLNMKNINFTILMIDIDFFKQVNDEHGHDVGDIVIVGLSEVLKSTIKGSDLVFRFGGEEFLVVLYDITKENAYKIAENIRVAFSKRSFRTSSKNIQKTLSIGIATYSIDANNPWQTIKFADIALYEAKNSGRNKVVMFESKMHKEEEY